MVVPTFFRPLLRYLPLGLFLVAAGTSLRAQSTGFDPNVTGAVNAVAVQPDGKIVLGGNFTSLKPNGVQSPTGRANAARVNADGTLDATFDPEANGQVTAVAVQPDGKVILGGYFTSVKPGGGAAVVRNHIARFNANGTLDTAFDPNATGGLTSQVNAIVVLSSGQILIGGNFLFLQPNGGAVVGLNRMARLNADGTVDRSFNPNANGSVNAIAVQADGQIVIGGAFTGIGLTTRNHVARLKADGTLDGGFDPNANSSVSAIAVQSNGQIVFGGTFTTVQPNGTATTATQNYMVKVNSDGTLDTTFNPQPSSSVNAILPLPNGQFVLGGTFVNIQPDAVNTLKRNYIARINNDGSADTGFDPNANYVVNALALQADGRIVLGGSFTQLKANGVAAGVNRNAVARINADGSLDTSTDPNVAGGVGAAVMQPNGQILVGGSFSTVAGVKRGNLVRLSATGVVDAGFDPEPNAPVATILLQPDGKILIGGSFTALQPNGSATAVAQPYLARLNADGTVDTAFNPSPNGAVRALALQTNGSVVFGGDFTQIGGTGEGHLARVSSAGGLDGNFNPNPDAPVNAILLQPSDNAIIIGGEFLNVTPLSTFTSSSLSHLARINATDGSVDTTFIPAVNGTVHVLTTQADGKILVGGEFTQIQPGGPSLNTVTSAGNLTTSNNPIFDRERILRLNSDGSLDANFNPVANSVVRAVTVQPNGQILLGGYFTAIQPNAKAGFAAISLVRVNADGTIDGGFSPAANGVVNSFAVQSNGAIVVGGAFTAILPTGAASLVTANHVTRLTAAGALDSSFSPSAK